MPKRLRVLRTFSTESSGTPTSFLSHVLPVGFACVQIVETGNLSFTRPSYTRVYLNARSHKTGHADITVTLSCNHFGDDWRSACDKEALPSSWVIRDPLVSNNNAGIVIGFSVSHVRVAPRGYKTTNWSKNVLQALPILSAEYKSWPWPASLFKGRAGLESESIVKVAEIEKKKKEWIGIPSVGLVCRWLKSRWKRLHSYEGSTSSSSQTFAGGGIVMEFYRENA